MCINGNCLEIMIVTTNLRRPVTRIVVCYTRHRKFENAFFYSMIACLSSPTDHTTVRRPLL